MAVQKKRLSLDVNFVFDLARDKDFAFDLLDALHAKGFSLALSPTAAHEIHFIFTDGANEDEREMARKALTNLMDWGIRPFDLDSTMEAVCRQFVQGLLRHQLLPEDEFNDGLILAETSVEQIPLLVTSDKHLLDLDEDSLSLAFNEADLSPVHPVHPKRLLRAFS